MTKFCSQKMAIVWSWMARNFQIILIVEKRPKRWKLFKTLLSEVFDYTKMNFFTMPITCRKGRRHFHICGIKRFDGVFFEILGTTSKHHIIDKKWQKLSDWLATYNKSFKCLLWQGKQDDDLSTLSFLFHYGNPNTNFLPPVQHHVVIYIADLDLLEEVL